jgi:NHL repeat
VRSHAKAPSAGSTSRQEAACRPRGAFLLFCLLTLSCLLPSSALADETHQLSFSFGAAGSGDGQLELGANSGVAVNESTHDIYVADTGNRRVAQFDSSGNFIRAFGADVGGAGIDVCTSGCVAGTAGSAPGAFEAPTFIAIDNSTGASNGDVYVADTANDLITKFHADGTLVSSWGVGGQLDGSSATNGPFGELEGEAVDFAGIAVDSSGNLFAFQTEFQGSMFKFAEDGAFIEDFRGVRGTRSAGIAVDPDGNLFKVNGDLSVEKFESTGADVGQVSASEEAETIPTSGLAVDSSNGELYIGHGSSIDTFAFAPSGEVLGSGCTPAPEAPCGPTNTFGAGDLSASAGLAVDGTSHVVYAADAGVAKVLVFAAVLLPDATTEDADALAATTATLHGTVNPNGDQLTGCYFDYISESLYRVREVQKLTVSATDGTFTLTFEGQSTAAIDYDAPASVVQSRLNALSTIKGAVIVSGGTGNEAGSNPYMIAFHGALGHKDVEAIAADASSLTGGAASAQIVTTQQGKPASFAAASSAPCEPAAASIPADSSDHAVKAEIGGLTPGEAYHFRLVAETAAGAGKGLDRVFTTAIGPPTVSAQSVETVGTSDAIVSAKVNPKGAKTTYHVEYGLTASYGQSSTESAPIGFGSDNTDHAISVHIGGLTAGTKYHFRFVATSTAGSTQGTDTSFKTYPPPPSFGPCPNDIFRTGFGARLPDCRAYEQATPVDKHGANIQGTLNSIQASSAGDRITFYLVGGLPTSGGSSSLAAFVASRVAAGWSSDGLLPATAPGLDAKVVGWSEDLAATLVAGSAGPAGRPLYIRDSDTATFQPGPVGAFTPRLAGFAVDTSHLIFESGTIFLPVPALGNKAVYDLDHGTLTLAGRIPSGSATSCDDAGGPACVPAPEGSFAGPYRWLESDTAEGGASSFYYTENTISRDGSRVFFTAAGSAQLYVRENGTTTTQVSASQRTVPDPNGAKPAAFMAATPDGSKVFFTSCEKLTDNSTAVSTAANTCTTSNQGQDLYSYDTGTGELTDLTVDSNVGDPKGADVQGVLGISEDGSYVYFVANGDLADGASPSDCKGVSNDDLCNLYVSHDGVTTFIASLDRSADSDDWLPRLGGSLGEPKTSRVSADGRTLLFSSTQSLTDHPNAGKAQLFHYSALEKELTCVSCNPTGVPPSGDAALGTQRFFLHDDPRATFLARNLSANGKRVFFDSPDALLPTDVNGVKDVYEWEADGTGSCESAGGCVYLISGGSDPNPSWFADASADGDHAFFFTAQRLVPFDSDQLYDVYDAGVGGGLPSQHPLSPPTCTSLACQANPAPPPEQTPASASFSGPGNSDQRSGPRRCSKGKRKVRRAGKVRCQKQRKHNKRHNNRGGSK